MKHTLFEETNSSLSIYDNKYIVNIYKYYSSSSSINDLFNVLRNMFRNELYANYCISSKVFEFGSNNGCGIIFRRDCIYKQLFNSDGEKGHDVFFHYNNSYVRIIFKYYKYIEKIGYVMAHYKIIYDYNKDVLIFGGKEFNRINSLFIDDVFSDNDYNRCKYIYDKRGYISRDEYRVIFSEFRDSIRKFQSFIINIKKD